MPHCCWSKRSLIKTVLRRGAVAVLLLLLGAAALHAADPKPAKAKPAKAPKNLPSADPVFTNAEVFRIAIEIPEEGMRKLRENQRQPFSSQGSDTRASVKAVVREGTNTYRDVALHLKGGAGSYRSIDEKPGLTLNFDKNIKNQTFHGLERLSLNNSLQDPTYLNEIISRELFAAAGVPVPRATHAKVQLNGRDLGIYVLTEAFNKQFLRQHFKSPDGNLYDGGLLKDVTDPLEKSSGPNPQDRSDLKRLAEAAAEPDPGKRLERLAQVMEVDQFITMTAMDILTCNTDGYALQRNNYRLYHDPVTGKITFMPHGLDQMFGTFRAGTDMPILPRMQGLVARAVIQTPSGREQFKQRVAQLLKDVYRVDTITNRVQQLAARLRPVLAEKGAGAVRAHEREVSQLCSRIAQRAEHVRAQLAAPDQLLAFDQAGVARLPDWQPKSVHGNPVLNQGVLEGKGVLHVSASGSAVGIWVTRVQLPPGKYRLEGRVKAQGVTADPGDRRGGVGFRAGETRPKQKLMGDQNWTDISLDFEVAGGAGGFQPFQPMAGIQTEVPWVELMCELRAAKGQAWFLKDTLRLIRR
jgi:spore coat protein H